MTEPTPANFPDTYTEEAGVPPYLHVTAEGKPFAEAVWSGLAYLRKYRDAKWTAPVEEVRHFAAQRRLFRQMPPAPAASPSLGVVGDLMWMRNRWSTFVAPEVLAYLGEHAAAVGNLESPISSHFSVPSLLPDYFTYNSPPDLLTSFRRPDGGNLFTALTTANNHSLDRGDTGLADTLAFLDAQKILHVGVRLRRDDPPYVLFPCGDVRVGLYAACWGLNNPAAVASSRWHVEIQPGLAPQIDPSADLSRVEHALAEMTAAGAELRLVYLHWGHEFEYFPRPQLMRLAHAMVAAGADIVIGSHPHVVQPLEVVSVNGYPLGDRLPASCRISDATGRPRKALIAYSLGNFSTAMFTRHCQTGVILSVPLGRDSAGQADWYRPRTRLVFNALTEPDSSQRRLLMLQTYLDQLDRHRLRGDDLRRLAVWLGNHVPVLDGEVTPGSAGASPGAT